ncbi:glycosyltransferase [Acinetobacter sp. ANC 3813]|uniref:glycosyltransferase n=1 Tax=Acinetobacter sp. ANC 3813 TaxID=1977873 RepID=UPI000A3597B1|nr:glycosyltransferase [Acinetobacter sp. ANC 3813]OTG86052.1 hypothetical protein B9T34_18355 [Acinetobacter sp. ANC 3813]
MYFFLSAGIGQSLTGIEHAILKRGKVFNSCGMQYKIVTLNHNPDYKKNLDIHGISESNFLNIYDTFQNIIFKQFKENNLKNFLSEIHGEIRVEDNTNHFDVKIYVNEVYYCYIHFHENEQISYVNYFDGERIKFKREIYTENGWLSRIIYLDKNTPKFLHYLDFKRNVVIEECFTEEKSISCILLKHFDKKIIFYNKNDFTKYWLDFIFSMYEKAVVYSDKNKLYNDVLVDMENKKFKLISVFHSVHVSNPKQIENGKLNSNYQKVINHKDQFDGFIVSTENQKHDLQLRFGTDIKIWVIPPSYAEVEAIEKNNHEDFTVISVGRYYVEKRLHHIIEAIELLKEKYPDIQLNLYGFGDSRDKFAYEKKIRAYVIEHQLENNVHFKGYSQNILSHLRESSVSVMTSTIEGFCIGILDSLSVGTPVVAYDIKYGPAEILQHDYSGYLVEEENINELSAAIEKCYLNTEMRENSVNSIEKFSFETLKKKWINHLLELSNV